MRQDVRHGEAEGVSQVQETRRPRAQVPVRAVRDTTGHKGGVGRAHVEAHQGRQVHPGGRRRQGQGEGKDAAQPRCLLGMIGGLFNSGVR